MDLETGEGIVNVPQSNLQKYIVIGNFIEVTSGAFQREKGWVIEVAGEIVWITEFLQWEDIEGSVTGIFHNIIKVARYSAELCNQLLISLYQPQDIHINWVKVTDLPLSLVGQPPTSSSMPADLPKYEQVPWISMEVIVCKVKHPMKGYHAIIKDVLPLQDTSSSLKITAQFIYLDPAHPFKTEVLDYDDVVKAKYVTPFLLVGIVG